MQVVSFYVDQYPADDMTRATSKQFNIPIYTTIGEACASAATSWRSTRCCSIGEHGNYPVNAKGQMEYPRKQFFDEIVAVFKTSGRAVPVFNDKHLSYRWDWAKEMVDTARDAGLSADGRQLGAAGRSAARRWNFPPGAKIDEADVDSRRRRRELRLPRLEVLQSHGRSPHAAARRASRRCSSSNADALWKAAADGRWSPDLAAAAMAAEVGADDPTRPSTSPRAARPPAKPRRVHAIARRLSRRHCAALALKVGNSAMRWNFACRSTGKTQPLATAYYVGPWQNRNLFKALSHAIQTHFREKKAPYPVERTLLVSGILDAAMDSRIAGGKPLDTPQLDVRLPPQDFRPMREMGDSWKIITEEMPEHEGIKPVGV